jgi:phage protein D
MDTRRATIELKYRGVNITEDVAPDLKNFRITDNASGTADDVAIELKDDTGKWISDWAPQKGDIVIPKILTTNWRGENDHQSLDCGIFLVDELSYTGRPRVFNIGAVSTPSNTDFMTTEKSRTWQGASVQQIARNISSNAKLSLLFDSKVNPIIDFIEQSKEPDVSFLFDVCNKYGLAMKLYNQKIVIFSEREYEAKEAATTLYETDMTRWDAKTTFTDTGYDGCNISYTDPNSGATLTYTFMAPGRTGKKIFKVNETATNLAEAERLTKAKLRELNKKEFAISFDMAGNLGLFSSQTFYLDDLGIFKGKYYIDKITRSLGNSFTCSLEAHHCLEGY